MHQKRNGGITLIDIMIVLVTLAVIAVLVVPQYNEKKARERREILIDQARSDLLMLKLAEESYFEEHGRYTPFTNLLSEVEPGVAHLAYPFQEDAYSITLIDTTKFDIACSEEDVGVIEAGLPSWIGDPGEELTRAELIKRSRRRMEKIRDAEVAYFENRGEYTNSLDSLETVKPGVKNLVCAVMMKRFSIMMPDSGAGYEITSHLDEIGSIIDGTEEYPPLPEPRI